MRRTLDAVFVERIGFTYYDYGNMREAEGKGSEIFEEKLGLSYVFSMELTWMGKISSA